MSLVSFKTFITSNDLYTDFMEELLGDITYQELLFESTSLLIEKSVVNPEGSTVDNDTMGKLHEILFAAHAHGGVDEKGNVTRHPEDTRSKGKKSADIYKALVNKIGGTKSDAYKKVNASAKATAEEWKKNHLPKGHEIVTGHWSSQAGDHERITGIKDTESKADVILQSKDKSGKTHFHPVSLKYTKSDPNLANNGLARISSEAGLPQGESLSSHWQEHMDRTNQLHTGSGDERSSQYKVDALVRDSLAKGKDVRAEVEKSRDALLKKEKSEGKLSGKYQKRLEVHNQWLDIHDKHEDQSEFIRSSADRAEKADKSKTDALKTIALNAANSYSMKGDGHIRGSLIKLATPHTVIPHTVAVSYTKDDGTSTPFTTTEHNFAHDHLAQFENLTSNAQGNGVVFYGKHKQTGKTTRIATLNFKGGNGPYEGANSTLVMHNIMRDTMERQTKNKSGNKAPVKKTETSTSAPVPKAEPKVEPQTKEEPKVTPSTEKTPAPAKKKLQPFKQTANAPTPTPAKKQIPSELKTKKEPAQSSPYDYKGARSQDLGRKISSGDTEAEKELQRRQAKKKIS